MISLPGDKVPVPVAKAKFTVWPSGKSLPLASTTRATMTLVLIPSAVRLVWDAEMVTPAACSAVNVTATVPDRDPLVAVTVFNPIAVELVSVVVATPLTVVAVKAERVPAVAENVTVVPSWMVWLLVSRTVAVMVDVDAPSATILEGLAVTDTDPI